MNAKTYRAFAVLALLCLLPRASALTALFTFDITQEGYANFGRLWGTLRILDRTDNGYTADDLVSGSFSYSHSLGNGRTFVRGFDITSLDGNPFEGPFAIFAAGLPGNGSATLTPDFGSVTYYEFPLNGNFHTVTSSAPVSLIWRVPDHGPMTASIAVLFGVAIAIHRRSIRSRPTLYEGAEPPPK